MLMCWCTLLLLQAVAPPLQALDAYLRQFSGFENLPVLSVRYRATTLHGQLFVNRPKAKPKNALLSQMPVITWSASSADDCGLLLFLDIDAGGKRSDADAGRAGPYAHSIWTHCKNGSNAECRAHKKYLPPGNTDALPNRYAFLLLRHACSAELKLPTSFKFGRDRLNLSSLMSANPGAVPVSATYMRVGGKSEAEVS